MSVILLIVCVSFYVIQKLYRISSRHIKRLDSVNGQAFIQQINETSTGLKIVRAFRKQEEYKHEFLRRLSDCTLTSCFMNGQNGWLSLRLNLLSTLILFVLLVIVNCYILFNYHFNAQSLALCIVYSMQITGQLTCYATCFVTTERECISLERVNQYIRNEGETSAKPRDRNKSPGNKSAAPTQALNEADAQEREDEAEEAVVSRG